ASIALFSAEVGGLLIWFLIPRFRRGEFGGQFILPVDVLPAVNDEPFDFPDGRFWLVNLDTSNPAGNTRMYRAGDEPDHIIGVAAIYKVCTHLGCIYPWVEANDRFECPCHGSKYRLDGRRIESPAPRTLDRFQLDVLAADQITVLAGSELIEDFFQPVRLPADAAFVRIDTGIRKLGPSDPLLCEFADNCP
ncbi:MAG: ubiquinol-cytochrome c reductase iron-sulfur subunit, partial [Anaerolineae bacterium]